MQSKRRFAALVNKCVEDGSIQCTNNTTVPDSGFIVEGIVLLEKNSQAIPSCIMSPGSRTPPCFVPVLIQIVLSNLVVDSSGETFEIQNCKSWRSFWSSKIPRHVSSAAHNSSADSKSSASSDPDCRSGVRDGQGIGAVLHVPITRTHPALCIIKVEYACLAGLAVEYLKSYFWGTD